MDLCKKKEKNVKPNSITRDREGDAWTHTAVKRGSYFFVAYSVGKRTQDKCREMMTQLSKRINSPTFVHRLSIYSDGNDDYTSVLKELYQGNVINYGQLVKVRQAGRVVDKIRRPIYGNPTQDDIETTDVENFNGILREHIGRIVRKTKCYAKNIDCLSSAIGLFQFYWNFMHKLHGNLTPAIEERLATKIWTWGDLIHYRIKRT